MGDRRRVRVLVADDSSFIREAISEFLSESFDVVTAVANGREAVEAVHAFDPDVAVLDISMPVLDGFGAARELVRRSARARILFLTVHANDEFVTEWLE